MVAGEGKEEVSEEVIKSNDEVNALDRSIKKVRQGEDVKVQGRPLLPREEVWMMEGTIDFDKEMKKGSLNSHPFKDVCVNVSGLNYAVEEEDDDWWRNDGWKTCITVNNSGKIPNIILSDDLSSKMTRRWSRTLIVSVLGMM